MTSLPPSTVQEILASLGISHHTYELVSSALDPDFYRAGFDVDEAMPEDCTLHYLHVGAMQGRDPTADFSTLDYLRLHDDVAAAGVNPFYHFLAQGTIEHRRTKPSRRSAQRGEAAELVYAAHERGTQPGPHAEAFDPAIVAIRPPMVKALAYYLPQFHPIPENDAWWGEGFTEWRNVARGMPRFEGHDQPRVPSTLGHYDLRSADTLRRQTALARAAGVHGFVFYYYWFNGLRILERPVDLYLENGDIDFPFALMWTNENWTRTWDGFDRDVLLAQDYRVEHERALLDDLARHFRDPRYIRLGERPLFFLYRPALIPDTACTIERWRAMLRREHGLDPLIFMAQVFGDNDPRPFGLDGAVEFPPHKVCQNLTPINDRLTILDPGFAGQVYDYTDALQRSVDEPAPPFPLIKTCVPGWDNEARRPGRGMTLHGATPQSFGTWARRLAAFARENTVFGEPIIAVNAWNEWAEAAYLEPDVQHGAANLNALARAVTGTPSQQADGFMKLIVFGHDANANGAQLILLHLVEVLKRRFGMSIHIVLMGGGALMPAFEALGPCTVIATDDRAQLRSLVRRLKERGFTRALTNTAVCGWAVPTLKTEGLGVVSLVHELATLIAEFGLADAARHIARYADVVVFPARFVAQSFVRTAGEISGIALIRPQGLYHTAVLERTRADSTVRDELGIGPDAKVVLNAAYADPRKGFDIFLAVARRIHTLRPDVHFVWVGDATAQIRRWHLPDARTGTFADVFHFTGRFVDNAPDYFLAADLLFLSSREDPYPSVVLEALAAGLPVVARAGTTGSEELIARFGTVVADPDVDALAAAIIAELDRPATEVEAAAADRRAFIAREADYAAYAFSLCRALDPSLVTVSAVVPNYNYARYAPVRLNNMFRQHYPMFEILVLDDCSFDNSPEAIRDAAARAERDITLIVNEANSGSVFRQWRKAVDVAKGEYIWIAEADDIAHEDFISTMVRQMRSNDAGLGFSDSWIIGSEGERLGDSYKEYLNDIEPGAFDASFVMDGAQFLRRYLSVKNIILNVSAVLWRREDLLSIMDELGDQLFDYDVAGDWRIYLEYCKRGGRVVYNQRPLNGHRRHVRSVTHDVAKQRHFAEIVDIQLRAKSCVELDNAQTGAQDAFRAYARRVLELDPVE